MYPTFKSTKYNAVCLEMFFKEIKQYLNEQSQSGKHAV